MIFAAAAVCLPVAAKEFRNSDVHPADYPTVMAVNYMSDIISKKTNGKHTIKTFYGGTLGSEKDTIEQTKLGGLDLVRINVAPMNNICAETMARPCRSCSGRRSTCARCSTARSARRS